MTAVMAVTVAMMIKVIAVMAVMMKRLIDSVLNIPDITPILCRYYVYGT